jgi:hypothetical protein
MVSYPLLPKLVIKISKYLTFFFETKFYLLDQQLDGIEMNPKIFDHPLITIYYYIK